MKLHQLLEARSKPKHLYHATNGKFETFAARPTWFSTSEEVAKGWHENTGMSSRKTKTLICTYTGGKIAGETEVKSFAGQIWPDEDFLYSMFDERINEFDKKDVRAFIKLLQENGFDAATHDDYDPRNFERGSTLSFVVFRPDLHITIDGEHDFES